MDLVLAVTLHLEKAVVDMADECVRMAVAGENANAAETADAGEWVVVYTAAD